MSSPSDQVPCGADPDSPGGHPVPARSDCARADLPDGPRPPEIGGRKGPEPTRYGDWEK
ncbi:MAG TPA: DUF1674 domain-containing protein, partial [Xanthomonadales bacterium]|nr:DUF1674 domain-containing protein [Xanthomonadales bacterium]